MASEVLSVIITGRGGDLVNEFRKIGAEAHTTSSHFDKFASVGKAALLGIGGAAIAGGVAAVKLGADFQQAMTQLVTGAGESEKNIKLVTNGILDMAGKVGKTPKELAAGLYMIESAGFHGAAGLSVLKAAAEGATVGNAKMATVANAVTSALNAYHLPASAAVSVTNALVATVGAGKMHMEDLAGAIGSVLAPAAAAGIKLSEVGGAMATMTSQGTDASKASMYLRQMIIQLLNPTSKARTEMKSLGLDAIDISKNLGKRGLAGTFDVLVYAIKSHMGPAGTVLIESLKKLAHHTTDFQKILGNLPPAQQTYVGALANMVGGTKGLMAALELTGGNFDTFQKNVKTVSDRMHAGGKEVDGFALAQKDLRFKTDALKGTIDALGTKLGLWLIPKLQQVGAWTLKVIDWFKKHNDIAKILAIAVGTVLVLAIAAYTANMVLAAAATVAAMAPILLVIAFVAILAAGLKYAYDHWGWFRDAVNHARDALQIAWQWIQTNWPTIKATLVAAIQPFVDALNWLKQYGPGILSTLGSGFQQFASAAQTALGPLVTMVNNLIGGLKVLGDTLSHIPGFGGGTNWNAPGGPGNPIGGHGSPGGSGASGVNWYVPLPPSNPTNNSTGGRRAAGGPVSPYGRYLVGEHGPELLQMGSGGGMIHPNGAGGGNTYVIVNVQGMVTGSAHEVGRFISDNLIQYERRTGKRWAAVVTP